MKAKVLYYNQYSFVSKETGELVDGRYFYVSTTEPIDEDNGNGSIKYGYQIEKVNIPKTINVSPIDCKGMVGKVVDLIYERRLGERYERLTAIKVTQ